jgi:hypothetical protein
MAYEPRLPEGLSLPAGHSINTASEPYKQLEAVATAHKWSQESFSAVLGVEAKRIAATAPKAAPAAPAPAPAAKAAVPANWDRMSVREQIAFGLNNGSTRSNRGQP